MTKDSSKDLTTAAMPDSNLEQPDRESSSRDRFVASLGILILASVITIPVFVEKELPSAV